MHYHDAVTCLEPATSEDPYSHEPVVDWSLEPTEHPHLANLQPLSSSATNEAVLTAETVISRWELFLPATVTLHSWWRVRWLGDDYEVDGKVRLWTRHGQPHHKHCYLRLVEEGTDG